jgi:hypothetical protein
MIEHKGDLWEQVAHPNHLVGISTNGYVKANGRAVMGRGCALQATQLFADAALLLGSYIKIHGNVPGYLTLDGLELPDELKLLILPVKHNWWERASLELVGRSRNFLGAEAHAQPQTTFHVPRLGCGNGRLDWLEVVRPLMAILPDNVWVHH